LLVSVGCVSHPKENGTLTMGITREWTTSELHIAPRVIGAIFIAPIEALFFVPFERFGDIANSDAVYGSEGKYLSYSGSRAVGRSDMGWGFRVYAMVFTIPIDTVLAVFFDWPRDAYAYSNRKED
jgi:hypothetical protein